MKMLIRSGFFFIFLAFLACKQDPGASGGSPATHDPGTETGRPGSNYTDDSGHTINMDVELNKGAKWEANVETTNGIGAMIGIVGEVPANATLEDYHSLQKHLLTRYEIILQRCTMHGAAHDQLHRYLMPLRRKIDILSSNNLEACQKIVPDIKEYLMKYSHFFYS